MVSNDLINRQTSQTRTDTMKVKPILNEFLNNATPSMHKGTQNALLTCISSVFDGRHLMIADAGRGIDSDAKKKHSIKRMDRLTNNSKLFRDKNDIYAAICRRWIPANSRPIILIDWSDLDERKNAFLISAALAYQGRSIPLFQEVHSIETKEKPATHKKFMETFKGLLPAGCQPIIVADAGFKVPWHRLVLELGWDYVGRARKPNLYSLSHNPSDNEDWQSIDVLFDQATSTATCFNGWLAKSNAFKTTFVSFRKKKKGRRRLTKQGTRCKSKISEQHAKSGKEPWLLVTSLKVTSRLAKRVVKIYETRMQIEENFRDVKSGLSGLGFNHSQSYKIHKIAILLLMAALIAMALILIGTAAELAGLAHQYQANSTKDRRVLSFHFLGKEIAKDPRLILTPEELEAGIAMINEITSRHHRNMKTGKRNENDKF